MENVYKLFGFMTEGKKLTIPNQRQRNSLKKGDLTNVMCLCGFMRLKTSQMNKTSATKMFGQKLNFMQRNDSVVSKFRALPIPLLVLMKY